MRKYILSSTAQRDVDEICRYLADRSPGNAEKILDDLIAAFELLGGEPDLGHERKDLTDKPVKFFLVYKWLVIYYSSPKPVNILTILHASRDVKTILDGF